MRRFAVHFDLRRLIRFEAEIGKVRQGKDGSWLVDTEARVDEAFDAVMVCNGHCSRPRVPKLENEVAFAGTLLHSHNYRVPEPFANQAVALFGGAASATDLAFEIATVASEVHWCAETHPEGVSSGACAPRRIHLHPPPIGFAGRKAVALADGRVLSGVDAFIFCTGYEYRFPFLPHGIVDVSENWVRPLYLDLVPPDWPMLAFIGLPFSVIPFPLFELQARWFAKMLSGKILWPGREAVQRKLEIRGERLRQSGLPTRHLLKYGSEQFAYMNRLARECGSEPLPPSFVTLAKAVAEARRRHLDRYRDLPLPEG